MGRIEKPWGYEEQVMITQVDIGGKTGMLGIRRLVINAEEMTSLARHSDQSDIIYLEEGTAILKKGDKIVELEKGEAEIIRKGTEHQIQNLGTKPAKLLEISFPYSPQDIERIEDPYSGKRN